MIVDENHTQAQAQASMPYLVSLQNTFGVTTNHTATTHPSLPNYLEIAGGSTFGVTDDAAPSSHPVSGVSVFGAAQAHGQSARTYNESMTTGCQQTSSGQYAVKHNPWAYFVDERTACRTDDVPLTDLPGDITAGALPTVGMITPNLCNDGHDCSLTTADAFLETWVPQIMNGPDYRTGHLSIVITFDEGVGTDQTIQTVVVNPALQAKVVTTPLTHAGLSRWLYRVSGSTPRMMPPPQSTSERLSASELRRSSCCHSPSRAAYAAPIHVLRGLPTLTHRQGWRLPGRIKATHDDPNGRDCDPGPAVREIRTTKRGSAQHSTFNTRSPASGRTAPDWKPSREVTARVRFFGTSVSGVRRLLGWQGCAFSPNLRDLGTAEMAADLGICPSCSGSVLSTARRPARRGPRAGGNLIS